MVTPHHTSIIHQSAKAKIEWIQEGKILVKTFTGLIVGQEMKVGFNAGLA